MATDAQLECFRYSDLVEGRDLQTFAERAFGRGGLGIVLVTGVPDIATSRRRLFSLGHRFANLPEETKAKYEHPESHFSFGWSYGKETLESGRPDLAKGSFYANPCHDTPFADDPAAVAAYPPFAHPNIWPDGGGGDCGANRDGYGGAGGGEVGPLDGFSKAFKELGRAVVRVGVLVARQCDRYVESVHPGGDYEPGKLERIVSSSRCHKARLLHYFPRQVNKATPPPPPTRTIRSTDEEAEETVVPAAVKMDDDDDDDDGGSFSDWCGWHHDHSSLTGLVPGMFLDSAGIEVENRDSNCGLFIRSRQGSLVKVSLPKGESASTCLLFQIGETTQVHSGGVLQATPHAVRSTSHPGVSREAFAVFMQPEWGESMDVPRGVDPSSTQSLYSEKLLPRGAAPILKRLRAGMNFGAFTDATLAAYY